MIAISGMAWFMTLAWESMEGPGIAGVSAVYATVFVMAGRTLWRQNFKIPGGLLFTLAVWMVPLIVYGIERTTGMWPQGDPGTYQDYHIWIKGSWIFMELGTILAGLLLIRFFRFPFITFPVAYALWYMSMDLTPLLLGRNDFDYDGRAYVSLLFGLLMILAGFLIDRRTKKDFAFWTYLFGLIAFFCGLSFVGYHSVYYFLICLGLIFVSILLGRRAFMIFGSIGVFGYLSTPLRSGRNDIGGVLCAFASLREIFPGCS